ncbi:MAG: esterase, partial [Planctomycetes bacterium SM23_32]
MALMRVQFFGTAIAKQTNMTILLPQDVEAGGPFPVLYQLHGLSDDDTAWTRWTSIERYVRGLPLIVVMPDSARGFYTDAAQGPAYEAHIMEDVMGLVDRFLPTVQAREGRAVGGLSMGGYGAMKLALKYPDRFRSVAAHSSAFDVGRRVGDHDRAEEFRRIFGDEPAGGRNDPFHLAEQVDRQMLPAIRFDCGTEDGLIEENRAFHAHLAELGIRHEYQEFPGAHDWGYWDVHVREALAFHCAALG